MPGEARAANRDVSLVASGPRAEVLRELGVPHHRRLAALGGRTARRIWPHGAFDDAVVIAKAWLAGAPLVRRYRDVHVHRADIEVDVDMESLPGARRLPVGHAAQRRIGTSVYRPFATWDPVPTVDEARSFAEFWAWLMDQRRAAAAAVGKTFAAYCYSRSAEDKWLLDVGAPVRRYPGHAAPKRRSREFIDSPQWVDIYQAVTDQFVCPNGKGLKKIAPVAGFHWRDAEAGGEASMSWYREAVGLRRRAGPRLSVRGCSSTTRTT